MVLGAGDPAAEGGGIQFFEGKIRPVLIARCYGCAQW